MPEHEKLDYHGYADNDKLDQREIVHLGFEKAQCTICSTVLTVENSDLFCVEGDGQVWWEHYQCNGCYGMMCRNCGEVLGMYCTDCR